MSYSSFYKRLGIALALGAGQPSMAAEIANNFETARVTARGGTYVAAPESEQSARFNPATLAGSPHSFQFRPLEINLSLSSNVIDTISDLVGDAGTGGDEAGPFLDILDKFNDKYGKRHLGRLDLIPFATRIGPVEVMPFVTSISFLEARQPSIPELYINTDNRAGVMLATGFSLLKNFEVGMSVKPTHRWLIRGEMAVTDILDLSEGAKFEDYSETSYGFGVGVDLAAVWKPTNTFRLAMIVENIGDMASLGDQTDQPPPIQQKISTGFWYRYAMKAGWNLDINGDWQDMVNRNGYNILRQTHMGMELGRSLFTKDHDVGFLIGLGQGYPSWGAFMDLWLFRLEISQFTRELGSIPGQRPDKRYHATIRTSMAF
ncbi:MAG: hypothetical protein ACOH5I_18635 [Oligoflexus sp.]